MSKITARRDKKMSKDGWIPCSNPPTKGGEYECAVRISSSVPPLLWDLEWDGVGFMVPCPMVVEHWRHKT